LPAPTATLAPGLLPPPPAAGCKWSTSYCRYPSINTINGRMCGNYAQLVVCVSQCYVA